ncbi:MAG TPA: SulP family inorganic anion transporter [Bryobacteraceae bacterium]|nr:SulP family inorganic anion transporter [Bryobacteraceae bacterium]
MFPSLFKSMRPITKASAARDAFAGVELAAMGVPQSLGYANIAGMPAVTGFYTLLLPILGFSAFGSSRYLVVAADSATAAILAGGISGMAPAGSARYIALAGVVALLTAGLLALARVLKLGFLADFLSQTVLTGFLTGVGFQVGIAVLGPMLGIEVHSHRSVMQLAEVSRGLLRLNWPSVGLSVLVVGGVLTLSRFLPRVPGPLIAVVGAVAASALWDFAGHGIAVIGPVASGLPHPAIPNLHWKDVEQLIPIAASCFVMIVTQSAASARIYAIKHHERLDENADLTGLAAANALAALSGTFVVNGSPTQTGVVESAGGRSQFAQVSTAAVVALVLLFFTHPLQYLPRCVLGAIVFIVATHLVDLKGLAGIRRESPGEYALAMTTAAVVVLVGVEQGIVLAMVMSLLRIVQHSYHPSSAVLLEGQGGIWQTEPIVHRATSGPGFVIYRFGAPLFYANAGRFAEEIREIVGPDPPMVRWVIVDAGAIPRLDYSASRTVQQLQSELAARNVNLVFAHVQPELKADLDRHHLTEVIGGDRISSRLHEVIAHYRVSSSQ